MFRPEAGYGAQQMKPLMRLNRRAGPAKDRPVSSAQKCPWRYIAGGNFSSTACPIQPGIEKTSKSPAGGACTSQAQRKSPVSRLPRRRINLTGAGRDDGLYTLG